MADNATKPVHTSSSRKEEPKTQTDPSTSSAPPPPVTEQSKKDATKPEPERPPSPPPANEADKKKEAEPIKTEADKEVDEEVTAEPEASIINMETFTQILELDEDEDSREFSKGMVWAYFTQAESTFKEMDQELSKKDLNKLSSLGHFLKGSSAALGLLKVQSSCEKIQHYGHKRDEEKGLDLTEAEALSRIERLITQVKKEYKIAHDWLEKWFEVNSKLDEVS